MSSCPYSQSLSISKLYFSFENAILASLKVSKSSNLGLSGLILIGIRILERTIVSSLGYKGVVPVID
jgi:hypothetical protein